ncbi:MAG: hypothetical protein AABN34_23920 [Acidobacteriota bacterium]
MRRKLKRVFSLLTAIATLLLITSVASAQEDTTPKKRLRSPALVRGFVGGESHDSYVIRLRRGGVVSVQISWRPEADNSASFTVSESPNFFSGEQVDFGKEYDGGKRWVGKIPKTRDYYIYVVAHPSAHYTLKVRVK